MNRLKETDLTLRPISKQNVLHIDISVYHHNIYLGSKINNDNLKNKTHNLIWQSVNNSFLNYCNKKIFVIR